MKQAKGYFGRRKNVWTVAKNAVDKAMQYSYRDRRAKKRTFRALWITRINAGAREHGMSYSQFMGKVKANNIELNRKVLADLAMNHPDAFEAIVKKVKQDIKTIYFTEKNRLSSGFFCLITAVIQNLMETRTTFNFTIEITLFIVVLKNN